MPILPTTCLHKSIQASLEPKVLAVRDAPEAENDDSDGSVRHLITKVWLLVL